MIITPGKSYEVVKADGSIISYKSIGGDENTVEILESTTNEFKKGDIVMYDVLYAGGYLSESEI